MLHERELATAAGISQPKLLTDLPADVVQHIVVRLTLAHHIARAAPTWRIAYHGLAP